MTEEVTEVTEALQTASVGIEASPSEAVSPVTIEKPSTFQQAENLSLRSKAKGKPPLYPPQGGNRQKAKVKNNDKGQTLVTSSQPTLASSPPVDELDVNIKVLEWDDLIATTDSELERLGWTTEQASAYLHATFGQRSRMLLNDEQMLDFIRALQAMP